MRILGIVAAGSLALLPACGDKGLLVTTPQDADNQTEADEEEELGVDVPSEAEAERWARESISPQDFDAELKRLQAELRDDR